MKKNNILILSHDYYPNNIWGVGKNVYEYINSSFRDYNIVLYTSSPRNENKKIKIITPTQDLYNIFLKGNYIQKNSFRDSNLLNALNVIMTKKIVNYYEETNLKPDIILNHGWMTWKIAKEISKKYNVKIITFVHFYEKQFLLSNNFSSKTDWNDIYKIENDMFNNSNRLVVFSQNQKIELCKLYNLKDDNVDVINHCAKLPDLLRNDKKDKATKILFVGRLVEDKGIMELIQVFNKLLKKYENLQLTIVGDGILKDKIENLNNKKIICTGWLEGIELYKQYVENDIFCFPTKMETFGMVLIEAMKYKIPIITTEGNTVSNIIVNNDTGLTIKLIDNSKGILIPINELYMSLEILIDNKKLRLKLANNAYLEYVDKYSNSEIKKINKLLDDVMTNEK